MRLLLLGIWLVISALTSVRANDTLFIRSIEMPGRVRNIDYDGRNLLVRLENGLYIYKRGKSEKIDIPLEGRFSWFDISGRESNSVIYHTDFIFGDKLVRKGELDNLLPGFYTNNITKARLDNSLFVSYRGVLLEYLIENDVQFYHHGRSVRHVYNNDSLRITSTYDGIFITKSGESGERLLAGTNYANGELSEINGRFYLCQDGLFRLQGDSSLLQVALGKGGAAFRKLILWQGETIALFNKRISVYNTDSYTETKTLLEGEELNDVDVFDGNLVSCSTEGVVYRIHPEGKLDTIFLNGAIHDLLVDGKELIVSSDTGLYKIDTNMQVRPIKAGIQILQTVSYNKDLFISSLNGLYLLHRNTLYTLIPNVEFNKRALSIFNNYLYAGSVDGLYVIQLTYFDSKILPNLEPYPIQLDNQGLTIRQILGIGIIIVGVVGFVTFLLLKQQRKEVKEQFVMPTPSFTPELISETIRNNKDITTVQALAAALGTSVVQLNRKLKSFEETPLSLMQKVKKEIALEMRAKGIPIDQIAKRTGYSKRYIREQFFKQA